MPAGRRRASRPDNSPENSPAAAVPYADALFVFARSGAGVTAVCGAESSWRRARLATAVPPPATGAGAAPQRRPTGHRRREPAFRAGTGRSSGRPAVRVAALGSQRLPDAAALQDARAPPLYPSYTFEHFLHVRVAAKGRCGPGPVLASVLPCRHPSPPLPPSVMASAGPLRVSSPLALRVSRPLRLAFNSPLGVAGA